MQKFVLFCISIMLINTSHAAINGLSDHSRANCVNNEGITWDRTKAHSLAVVSFHTSDYMGRVGQYGRHRLQTQWAKTKRAAAVCWGEGTTPAGYYLVQSWHWEGVAGVGEVLRATTSVDNCSIYNGWWDF
jgi:hypothetical protein